jgi:hypothetical protein
MRTLVLGLALSGLVACRGTYPPATPRTAVSTENAGTRTPVGAAYIETVKRKVRAKWHPQEGFLRLDPDGSKFGRSNRYTLVRAQIRANGDLADTRVETACGVQWLDDTAVQALRDAVPYRAPPRELVKDGVFDFRFGFFFQLDDKAGRPTAPSTGSGSAEAAVPGGDAHSDDRRDGGVGR